MATPGTYKIGWEEFSFTDVTGKKRTMPVFKTILSGAISLGTVPKLMAEIRDATIDIKGAYIAVTDLRKLEINEIVKRLFILGMESAFKQLFSVKNKAALSFVIFEKDQKGVTFMKDILTDINTLRGDEVPKYEFNYIFISDPEELKTLVPQLLAR